MTVSLRKMSLLATTAVVFAGGLLWNGSGNIDRGLVSKAEARIGRPLTPMSYAGVARRTTRRAVVVGGAVAAGAVAAGAYAAPGCAQVVDAYGRVYTRC
jgi:cytochrome c-type biogenesis protein CcmH/NrfG